MTVREPTPSQTPIEDSHKRARERRRSLTCTVVAVLFTYGAAAYVVAPEMWRRYTRRHPAMEGLPGVTYTAGRIPGDPVNVSLIGTEAELIQIMIEAKWRRADPLSLRSSLEIAETTVLGRPYDDAPVSNLYLFGRKEDLAFEQEVGADPRHRHHVRFWKSTASDPDGRPVWMGAAVYDKGVGFSHTTGQITHHTAEDVDAERDYLFECLESTRRLAERYDVPEFHKSHHGRNGGGDPWKTDGKLYVGVIAAF